MAQRPLLERMGRGVRAFREQGEATSLARRSLPSAAPRELVAKTAAYQRGLMRYQRARNDELQRFIPGGGSLGGFAMESDPSGGRGMIHFLGSRSAHELDQDYAYRRAEGIFLSYRNPHARKAANVIVEFAIGNGLNINPKGPKRRKGQRSQTRTAMQIGFNRWYRETSQCDAHDQKRGFQIERQIVGTSVHQGACIVWLCRTDEPTEAEIMRDAFSRDPGVVRRRSARGPAREVPLAIRVLSTRQLADDWQTASEPGLFHTVRNGVEYDRYGKEFGFWIRPNDDRPGEPFFIAKYNERIGDRPQMWIQRHGDMLPGQHFPTPSGCFVLDTLTEAADLRHNVLTRTRSEARQGHTINMSEEASMAWRGLKGDEIAFRRGSGQETYEAGVDYDEETGEELVPQDDEDISDDELARQLQRITASISDQLLSESEVPVLPAGWSITSTPMVSATPSIELLRDLYRVVSIGYGVPFSMLTGDSSQANFSADKILLTSFYNMIVADQESMLLEYAANVTSAFAFVGWSIGKAGYNPKAEWSTRANALPSIEPEKELGVTIMKLANHLKTLRQAWEEAGEDPDEMEMALEEQNEFLERLGAFDRPLPFSKSPQFLQDNSAKPASPGAAATPDASE